MRKSLEDIWVSAKESVSGTALVVLTVVGFIVGIWVLMAAVRIVAG